MSSNGRFKKRGIKVSLLLVWSLCSLTTGCKKATFQKPEIVEAKLGEKETYAPDPIFQRRNSLFYFKIWNKEFKTKFAELPKSGQVDSARVPRSGGYYPERLGGSNAQGALTKYDRAFNEGQNKAAQWESEKHTNGPRWAGHCNGWAAASTRHTQEPFNAVQVGSTRFEPQDVKALLAEVYMSADFEFLGGSRCENRTDALSERVRAPERVQNPQLMDACEDVNPGTLHAAVGNWIGGSGYPIIFDVTSGEEVWNYPVFEYEVLGFNSVDATQARLLVSGSGSDYLFNKAAVSFVQTRTRFTYANALDNETLGTLQRKDLILEYVLELDDQGQIIGGEWIKESRQKHPDFIWIALGPFKPNGTRYLGNPHVTYENVLKIYAESIGTTVAALPKTLERPDVSSEWGKWPLFEVTVDGNSRGSVFGGKPIKWTVTRKGSLADLTDLTLELYLNNLELKPIPNIAQKTFDFQIPLTVGPSLIRFTWKKDAKVVEEQTLNFYVIP